MRWWVMKKPLHVSWLIAAVCWGVIIGIICAQYVQISGAWLYVGILFGAGALWKRWLYVVPLAVGAGLLIGLARGAPVASQLSVFQAMHGRDGTVKGVVSEDPDKGSSGLLNVKLTHLQIDGHEVEGQIWASVYAKGEIRRSDTVTLKGRLEEGFGNISAAMYRANVQKVERPVPGDMASRARDEFAAVFERLYPNQRRAWALAMLWGSEARSRPILT